MHPLVMNNLSTNFPQNPFVSVSYETFAPKVKKTMRISRPTAEDSGPCVVYLDDEPGNRQAFEAAFRKDFKVLCAATLEEAWSLLKENRVHVLITDQRMPGMKGSELLALVRQRYPQVRRMLVTAYADLQAVVDALNSGGACFYIQKPWELETVRAAVERSFTEIMAEEARVTYTKRLVVSNQQLEFALRQRLLS